MNLLNLLIFTSQSGSSPIICANRLMERIGPSSWQAYGWKIFFMRVWIQVWIACGSQTLVESMSIYLSWGAQPLLKPKTYDDLWSLLNRHVEELDGSHPRAKAVLHVVHHAAHPEAERPC